MKKKKRKEIQEKIEASTTSIFLRFSQNARVHVYVCMLKIRLEALYVRSKRMKLKSNIVYHLNKKSVLKTKKRGVEYLHPTRMRFMNYENYAVSRASSLSASTAPLRISSMSSPFLRRSNMSSKSISTSTPSWE